MEGKNLNGGMENRTERPSFIRFIFKCLLCVFLVISLSGYAIAVPTVPPPDGKVWVEKEGKWILVVTPPGDGPYIWVGDKWVPDPTPPPSGTEWVPGHWTDKGWVHGHWEVMQSPGPGTMWAPGHWKGNKWVPGHWKGSPPRGKKWEHGHRGPGGRWVPGHWK